MVCLIIGFVLICPCGGREDQQVEEDGARCHPRAGMEEEGHRCETAAAAQLGEKSVTRVTEETVTRRHSRQKPLRQTLTKVSIPNSEHSSEGQ